MKLYQVAIKLVDGTIVFDTFYASNQLEAMEEALDIRYPSATISGTVEGNIPLEALNKLTEEEDGIVN